MDLTSDAISPLLAYGRRVNQNIGFLRVVPRLRICIPSALAQLMVQKREKMRHTLISISLNSDMLVDDHDLNVAISLLLARVDRPAHILGCLENFVSALMSKPCP